MIISPRSTPEVPHVSVPLPAPLGPQPTDVVALGSLRVPDPTVTYRPFTPPDVAWTRLTPGDPAWTEGGVADAKKGVALGNGGTRYGGPHAGRIEGLQVDGQPVEYQWKGHNYWWMLALDDVLDDLQLAGDEATRRVGRGTVAARNGERVAFQTLAAPDGTSRVLVTLPGSHALRVTSKSPLSEQAVKTLCGGLAECPAVALRGLHDIYVVENLGEKIDDQGEGSAHPLSAVTRTGLPDITFVRARLEDPEVGRHVVLHEVGHLVDGLDRVGCVSATQLDDQQRPVFGSATTVEPDHAFNLAHDDCVSHYGSLSAKEDFAEVHALLMRQRTDFNLANPGHDLLGEVPQVASAYLSPHLGLKAEAIVERYRELGHEAPRESLWHRLQRRLHLA